MFDFYDMVCTASWEEVLAIPDGEESTDRVLCDQTIREAQAKDPFCVMLRRFHEESGKWMPDKSAMRRQCAAWAPYTVVDEGTLYHRRTGSKASTSTSEDIGLRVYSECGYHKTKS